jgi:phosphomannomutase
MSVRNCTYCITHPPEYNGYKVYWQDGGQIVRRRSYYKYYRKLNFNQIKFEANEDLIHYIGAEVDQAFIIID